MQRLSARAEEPGAPGGGQEAGDAVTQAGFCRDHRGKLQSVWELCEDVADHKEEDGEDEAGQQAQGQLLPETPLPGVTPWPADRLVSGALELRASATRRRPSDMKATCTIQHGVMTFRSALHPGAEMVTLAEVPVSDIVATVVPNQTRKFSICNLEHIDSTQVWCCAKDQEKRDKWLNVLHRLGVDLYREDDDGDIQLVRQGVQVLPGRRQH